MKKGNKEKVLTVRERILIKGLFQGLSTAEAMRQAGYAETTIQKQSGRTVGNSRVKRAIQEILEEQGMTDEKLADVAVKGLDAQKVISAVIIAPKGEGMKDANSMTKDFIEVPDYDAQHKFLVTGLKLKGHLRDKLNIDLTAETYEQRRKRLGLDDMSPEEALAKLEKEHEEGRKQRLRLDED